MHEEETASAKAFCATFSNLDRCIAHCIEFCKSNAESQCEEVNAQARAKLGAGAGDLQNATALFHNATNAINGSFVFGLSHHIAPPPPARRASKGLGGAVMPLMLLIFFGCFLYQNHIKKYGGRGRRSSRDENSEGVSLIDCMRPAARAMKNRASDMLERRCEARRGGLTAGGTANGQWDGHDEDEDGML